MFPVGVKGRGANAPADKRDAWKTYLYGARPSHAGTELKTGIHLEDSEDLFRTCPILVTLMPRSLDRRGGGGPGHSGISGGLIWPILTLIVIAGFGALLEDGFSWGNVGESMQ